MTDARNTAAVILAAGASSRFGSSKALAALTGRPLLQQVRDVAAEVGFGETVVVLGHGADEIERRMVWRKERRVRNPEPDAGLSSSLRVGLSALGSSDEAALIMLGDQPFVRAGVILQLLASLDRAAPPIAVPRYHDGGGSNPVLIRRDAWPLAAEARADRGLGPILRAHPELVVEIDVTGSNPDVDTPADLAGLERREPAAGERAPAEPAAGIPAAQKE
jgi:molybdenum cofactor cytidylyltransferase